MSNYYQKRDAKVNIAHALMERGWDVKGYKKDESDSMTDYYSPANWDGIATKNGYILIVDNRYSAEAKEITKYNPKGNLSFEDREKITKLEAMTQENGATAGEEQNAKQLINKIKEKVLDQPAYEVVGMSLAHMANPKGSIWHIEKDGKIYDKGNALTKFDDMPKSYVFDINTMQFTDHYKKVWVYNDELGQRVYEDRQLTEKERKVINEFKALILRFERVTMGMNSCGDGTAKTEKTGLEQQGKAGYELKTITKTKTGLKMVEITDRKYIKVGDYIKTSHHCCYWKVTEEYMRKGTWKGIQEEKKAFIYEQVGKESRGFQSLRNAQRYYDYEFRMLKDIEEGKTKIYELKEVTETIEVEKWVKINKNQKTYNSKTEIKQEKKATKEPEQKKEQPKQAEQKTQSEQPKTEQTEQEKPTLNINSESGNIELTFVNPPNLETKNNLRLNGFRLNYNTKVWEIKNTTKNLEKLQLIFDITPEQTQTEPTRNKAEETADNIIDKSTEIITELELTPEQYPTNEEYKTALKNYIDKHNIKITDEILDYIRKQELFDLAEVLEYFNIKDGFIYDCHFKEWDMSIEDIKKAITALNIPFIDYGKKIGFKGITAEQTRQVKQISDKNNSIFFIDAKTAITEQPEEQQQPDNIINMDDYKIQEEEPEIMNNSDDIFSKFDNIEINNNSRISTDDEQFCETEQEEYNRAFNALNKIKNVIQKEIGVDITADRPYSTQKSNNKYLDYYNFESVAKRFEEIQNTFIHNIIGYFTQKYKITIDSYKLTEKYKNKMVDINLLIDEIFIQLGGYSFTEKAEKEIKDNLKSHIRESKNWRTDITSWNIEIKNKKIIFSDLIYASKGWSNKYSYNGHNGMIDLCKALSLFDCNSVSIIYRLNEFCQYSVDEWAFDLHELNMNKVDTMKIFKNSKIEITFKTAEYAQYFAKEYCGYIENSKTA